MKFALGRMNEYLFNAVRLTFSAITLGALLAWKYRKKTTSINGAEADAADGTRPTGEDAGPPRRLRIPIWRRYSRRQWVSILSFSFLAGFAYQVCFLLGIDGTTAGNTALIMSAIPMWTAILAFLMIGERLKRGAWAGLWIALAGVLIVTFSKPSSNIVIQGSLVGNLIVSLAAFSWAFASVLSRPLMKTVSPLELAFLQRRIDGAISFSDRRSGCSGNRTTVRRPLVDVGDCLFRCVLDRFGLRNVEFRGPATGRLARGRFSEPGPAGCSGRQLATDWRGSVPGTSDRRSRDYQWFVDHEKSASKNFLKFQVLDSHVFRNGYLLTEATKLLPRRQTNGG